MCQKLDLEKAREGAATLELDPNVLTSRVGKYSKGMGQKLGLLTGIFNRSAAFGA